MKRVLIVGKVVFKDAALGALAGLGRFDLGWAEDADGAFIQCLGDMPDCVVLEEVDQVKGFLQRMRASARGPEVKVIAFADDQAAKARLTGLGIDVVVVGRITAGALDAYWDRSKLH